MIIKSFLSGIFSVVSFILISNFATPSTFALCPPDVSGTWTIKGVDKTECCPDSSDNGTSNFKTSFVVMQIGDEISGSWVDGDGNSVVLTGVVNGNSVDCKIEGTNSDDPECGWVTHIVGIINGKRIKFYTSRSETCNTCKGHAKGTVIVVK